MLPVVLPPEPGVYELHLLVVGLEGGHPRLRPQRPPVVHHLRGRVYRPPGDKPTKPTQARSLKSI